MGFLDGSSVTVDAILTKHGRLKLAEGGGLGITKFALADDGVDYNLWNIDHPSGSAYYGEAITNLPMVEAVPEDSIMMRHTLQTLDRDTIYGPYLSAPSSITLSDHGRIGKQTWNITTVNGPEEMYMFKIYNSSMLVLPMQGKRIGGSYQRINAARQEIPETVIVGPLKNLELQAKTSDKQFSTTVEAYGVVTGATTYASVTVKENVRNIVGGTSG